jgi:hypothetical protein
VAVASTLLRELKREPASEVRLAMTLDASVLKTESMALLMAWPLEMPSSKLEWMPSTKVETLFSAPSMKEEMSPNRPGAGAGAGEGAGEGAGLACFCVVSFCILWNE